MKWFLVVTMFGSDDLLVKEMPSKHECEIIQKQFLKKAAKKVKDFESITCEEGFLMKQYDIGVDEDEIL